jgi:hypothetical protein
MTPDPLACPGQAVRPEPLYTKARVKLNDLMNAHPNTAAATEAQTLLNEIGPE